MIFDPITRALYGADGQFLKAVDCPLPAGERELRGDTGDRYCSACAKTIRNLDLMDEAGAKALVQADSNVCVFATRQARNITVLQPMGHRVPNLEDLPHVQTLRSLDAMNVAQSRGFTLVMRDVGPKLEWGDSKYVVYRNAISGEFWWSGDFRCEGPADERPHEEDWQLFRNWFWSRPDRAFPLAAYAIHRDLTPGTKVYVPDVIEDLRYEVWNQGNSERTVATTATWTGEDLELDQPEEFLILG